MEYRLGNCSVRTDERTLRCRDELVALPPKAVDALLMLASRQGDVVSKDALMDALWGTDAAGEANLTQNIYRLRKVLQRHAPMVRVQTVPRRGYRLTVDAAPNIDATPSFSARARRLWLVGAAILGCVIIAASVVALRFQSKLNKAAPPSYAQGYYYWSTSKSIADVRKSLPYFKRAIVEGPSSALGYAGLADAHLSLALRDTTNEQSIQDVRAGMQAARKAISVDPSSSEAHAAFGQGHALFGNPSIAEHELAHAVRLDPDSVEARTWYGELLMDQGRIAAATIQFRVALRENSTWTEAGDDLALLAYLRRAYSQAIAYADQSLAQEPNDTFAPFTLALAEAGGGRRQLAERQLQAYAHSRSRNAVLGTDALLTLLYAEDQNTALARSEASLTKRALQRLGVVSDPSTIISIAATLERQHQSDAAFAWLARVDRASRRLYASDPRLDLVRTDRRFAPWARGA